MSVDVCCVTERRLEMIKRDILNMSSLLGGIICYTCFPHRMLTSHDFCYVTSHVSVIYLFLYNFYNYFITEYTLFFIFHVII